MILRTGTVYYSTIVSNYTQYAFARSLCINTLNQLFLVLCDV